MDINWTILETQRWGRSVIAKRSKAPRFGRLHIVIDSGRGYAVSLCRPNNGRMWVIGIFVANADLCQRCVKLATAQAVVAKLTMDQR